MLHFDELYCISIYLDYYTLIQLSKTNQYHYIQLNKNNLWYNRFQNDYPYTNEVILNKKNYIKMVIAYRFSNLLIDSMNETVNIIPSRNTNRYDWLKSYFGNIIKSEPNIQIVKKDYKIILYSNYYEELYFEYVTLNKKDMIQLLSLLFYENLKVNLYSDTDLVQFENYRQNYLNDLQQIINV
jgi:hypothetical protein